MRYTNISCTVPFHTIRIYAVYMYTTLSSIDIVLLLDKITCVVVVFLHAFIILPLDDYFVKTGSTAKFISTRKDTREHSFDS